MERQLKQGYGVQRFSCFVCDCCLYMLKLTVHDTKACLNINANYTGQVKNVKVS